MKTKKIIADGIGKVGAWIITIINILLLIIAINNVMFGGESSLDYFLVWVVLNFILMKGFSFIYSFKKKK